MISLGTPVQEGETDNFIPAPDLGPTEVDDYTDYEATNYGTPSTVDNTTTQTDTKSDTKGQGTGFITDGTTTVVTEKDGVTTVTTTTTVTTVNVDNSTTVNITETTVTNTGNYNQYTHNHGQSAGTLTAGTGTQTTHTKTTQQEYSPTGELTSENVQEETIAEETMPTSTGDDYAGTVEGIFGDYLTGAGSSDFGLGTGPAFIPDLPTPQSCQTMSIDVFGHQWTFPTTDQCTKLEVMKDILEWFVYIMTGFAVVTISLRGTN